MIGLILQEAQQLGLGAQTEGGDFVQEQGPALRLRDEAGLGGPGAGEGSLLMPEQFALEQIDWDGPTVNRQKWLSGPTTEIVQGGGAHSPLPVPVSPVRKQGCLPHCASRGSLRFSTTKAGASPTRCASPTVAVPYVLPLSRAGALLQSSRCRTRALELLASRRGVTRKSVAQWWSPSVAHWCRSTACRTGMSGGACRLRPERRQEMFGPLPGRWQDWEHQSRTGFHTLCPIREWAFEAAHRGSSCWRIAWAGPPPVVRVDL